MKSFRNKLKLNIKPLEAVIRVILGFGLTFFILVFHSMLAIIAICCISMYLLISAMILFCPIKAAFQHLIVGKKGMTKEEKEMPFKEL